MKPHRMMLSADRPAVPLAGRSLYQGLIWRHMPTRGTTAGRASLCRERTVRDPDIAVGIDDIGFPQAMGLVGCLCQNGIAEPGSGGRGLVGIMIVQAQFHAR